jgi:HlyD family secretion protein
VADPVESLRRHALAGLAAIALFVAALGGWAGTTEIAGAVIAQGNIVSRDGTKRVQHGEGGVVTAINVQDGDVVEAGDVLLRLDATTVAANLAVITSQLSAAFALEARLVAEGSDSPQIAWTDAMRAWRDPALAGLVAAQERLMTSRAEARRNLNTQLEEQVAQLGEQIKGLEAQGDAVQRQIALVEADIGDAEALYAQGLMEESRLNASRRALAELQGSASDLAAQIAGARTAIAAGRAKIAESTATFRSDVLEALREAGLEIAELMQEKIAAEDRLGKLDIRAPQAGTVHEASVRTVGGVVAAGETLMLIVPPNDRLALDTRVSPLDIDKLHAGQAATVRLLGLDIRATPELTASIETISPDLSRDPDSGAAYYAVRITLPPEELARLPAGQTLVAGMPAEAFLRTTDRTVLSYLLGPLEAQLNHAFRED